MAVQNGVPSARYLKARQRPAAAASRRVDTNFVKAAVYFVQGEKLSLVKIGCALDINTRLATLQVGSPDRLRLLGIIECENAKSMEEDLHDLFGAHRVHGEWFAPAPELLAYIKANAQTETARLRKLKADLDLVAAD